MTWALRSREITAFATPDRPHDGQADTSGRTLLVAGLVLRDWARYATNGPRQRGGTRTETWIAGACLAALVVGFVVYGRGLQWNFVDDAGIALAFGQTLFAGHGFRLTANSQTVEGFSSPLWTLFQGLSAPLGFDGATWSVWLGLAFGGAALAALAHWGPAAQGRRLGLHDVVAPAIVAANASLLGWCSSGMETGLWACAHAVAGLLVLRAWRTGERAAAGVALGLLAFVRPEAPIYLATAAPGFFLSARRLGRPLLRDTLRWLVPCAAVLAALLLARWILFADLVPNTYWAKRAWKFNEDGAYLRGFVDAHPSLFVAAGAGLALALLLRRGRAPEAYLALAWAACALFFARVGDWMGEWRFAVPAVPFLAFGVGVGMQSARDFFQRSDRSLALRAVGATLLVLSLGASGLVLRDEVRRHDYARTRTQFPFTFVRGQALELGREIAGSGEVRPRLAFADMGGLAAALPQAEIVDLAGLCDRAMARHALNPAAQEDYLVHEGLPSWLDVHGPSGFVGRFSMLMAHYEMSGPYWHLAGLDANNDPRCPDGRRAELERSPAALLATLTSDVNRGDAELALRRYRCAVAYRSPADLPTPRERRLLADYTWSRSKVLEDEGALIAALRHASLATVLRDQEPALRRRTEQLRERLLPPPALSP